MIEVEKLISKGNELTRLMRLQGLQMQAEQLPISAIVRCPLLAIRWQLPNKKVAIESLETHQTNQRLRSAVFKSGSSRTQTLILLTTTLIDLVFT